MSKTPRSTTHGRWFWIGEDAAQYALTVGGAHALAVYAGLCARQSKAGGKNNFYASAANISASCGLGRRTVERYLPLLARAGLIEISSGKKAAKNGGHEANIYSLPAPPSVRVTHSPSATVAEASAAESCVSGGQVEGLSQTNKPSSRAPDGAPGAVAPAPVVPGQHHGRAWL